nr:MAG TPA: hypothetical protein [Caudoviricetes sp.]
MNDLYNFLAVKRLPKIIYLSILFPDSCRVAIKLF